jgi:hypothetical protein
MTATRETIVKQIGSIGKAAAKLTRDVQACAINVAWHAVEHGDVTLADSLVDAIGKQGRKASLRAWFEKNTPMYLPKGKDKFAFDKDRAKAFRTQGEEAYRASLADKPWEDAKPEAPVVSVFDVSEAADKFLKRLETMAKDAAVTVRNRELLEMLGATVAHYHAEQAIKARVADAE